MSLNWVLKLLENKDTLISETWDKVDYSLKFTESMVNFLRAANKDGVILHLVYNKWGLMTEKIKETIFY